MLDNISTSSVLTEQIMSIFLILLVGVLCYKTKLIDDEINSRLSKILLTIVQPVLIFTSFQREFRADLMGGLCISFLLAITTHIVGISLSYILIRRKRRRVVKVDGVRTVSYEENQDVAVERLTSAYGNMGFIGIPLANGIFGSEGVFYVTASIMVFNIFMWTHGFIMVTGSKKLKFKDILTRLRSPALIAIYLGLIVFIFQIELPSVLNRSLNYVGSINTPFGMLIAGATIAKSNLVSILFGNLRKYYMVFMKLLLIPIVMMLIYVWLPIDDTVKLIAIMMAGTPTTTIGTILTIRYKKNSILAGEIFALTTLLCALTIPFIIKIAELLIK